MTAPRIKIPGEGPVFDIEVDLSHSDGNAFMLLGKVRKAIRRAGATEEQIAQFTNEATMGDYDNLLGTLGEWVHIA